MVKLFRNPSPKANSHLPRPRPFGALPCNVLRRLTGSRGIARGGGMGGWAGVFFSFCDKPLKTKMVIVSNVFVGITTIWF